MRALELNAEYFGVSQLQLMENAGHNIALEIHQDSNQTNPLPFSVV